MRRVAGVIASAVVVLLVLPSRLAAQGGIIWGRVADTTGALLPRATVSVEATGGRTTSDDQGNYEIRRVPAGTHTVRVRLLGYVAQTVRIAVSEEQTVRQDFWLRRQPIGRAPVDLVVGSRARHTGAEELAVPVDAYPAEALAQQGTSETSQILQALTASMAREVAHAGIRVNAICPGIVDTARMDDVPRGERWEALVRDNVPLGRAGTGEDIAAAVLYLCSDQGSWITGQSYNVCGGMVVH